MWEPVLRLDAVTCAVKDQNTFTIEGVHVDWFDTEEELSRLLLYINFNFPKIKIEFKKVLGKFVFRFFRTS